MSKRPIVKEGGMLRLTEGQIAEAMKEGLSVSYVYRKGCRRRIMKARLHVRGCDCCGIFTDIRTNNPEKQAVFATFVNTYSIFSEKMFGYNSHY